MKMKLMKNEKYLQQKFSRKVDLLVPQTTDYFTSRVSKSYVPFTCKFPIVMHFVLILHRCCRSKIHFYVFSYYKTSLKFCASFRFFLVVFMEKIQIICYLNYVRRGIGTTTMLKRSVRNSGTLKQQIMTKERGHWDMMHICASPMTTRVMRIFSSTKVFQVGS